MDFFRNNNGEPFIPLGLQVNNSSTGDSEMMDREMQALKLFGGNLLEAPVYWFQTEPEEGHYHFEDVDDLIKRCRTMGVSLILLWFGFNKNGHPTYAPEWVKLHPEKYRLALGPDQVPVASLSPLCEETREADCRAFCALMQYLRKVDSSWHTVIGVQVENEIGLANTDMDYHKTSMEEYSRPVPSAENNTPSTSL